MRPLPVEAISPLMSLLTDPEATVRLNAAQTLLSAGECVEESISALVPLLTDLKATVRLSAARKLLAVGERVEEALSTLMPLLADTSASVRRSSAEAFGEYCTSGDIRLHRETGQKVTVALHAILESVGTNGKLRSGKYKRVHDYVWEVLWKVTTRMESE